MTYKLIIPKIATKVNLCKAFVDKYKESRTPKFLVSFRNFYNPYVIADSSRDCNVEEIESPFPMTNKYTSWEKILPLN